MRKLATSAPSRENGTVLTRFRMRSKRSIVHFRSRCLTVFFHARAVEEISFSSILAKCMGRKNHAESGFAQTQHLGVPSLRGGAQQSLRIVRFPMEAEVFYFLPSIFAKCIGGKNTRNRGFRSLSRTIELFRNTKTRGCCTFPRKWDCSHSISLALDRLYKNATVTRKYGSALSWI